jgi:hypothetical protein
LSHHGQSESSRSKASTGKNDSEDRPGASGHRFGPDLACSECGILWDVHQRQPKPCKTEVPADAFARRPVADVAENAASRTPDPIATTEASDSGAASTDASTDAVIPREPTRDE